MVDRGPAKLSGKVYDWKPWVWVTLDPLGFSLECPWVRYFRASALYT